MNPRENAINNLEPFTRCNKCNINWGGLITICEKCGEKLSTDDDPYTCLDQFCHYDEALESIDIALKEQSKLDQHKHNVSLQASREGTAQRIFNKFDNYSCIKNDQWYKDFKKEFNIK